MLEFNFKIILRKPLKTPLNHKFVNLEFLEATANRHSTSTFVVRPCRLENLYQPLARLIEVLLIPVFSLLLLSCEPNRLEVVETFENGAPKESFEVSAEGEKEVYFSWYRNGIKQEEMPYSGGVPNGFYRKWNISGVVVEKGYYRDSLREGVWQWFAVENKPFMRGLYKKGLRNGKWEIFDENGKLTAENFFVGDSAVGVWRKFHSNGKIAEENSCHSAYEHGLLRTFAENGNPIIYQECLYGKINGNFMSYYAGGARRKIGRFENGMQSGQWIEYYANGGIRKIENWVYGMRNGEWFRFGARDDGELGILLAQTEFIDGNGSFEDTTWKDNKIDGFIDIKIKDGEYKRTEFWEKGKKVSSADYFAGAAGGGSKVAEGFWKNGKKDGVWRNWYKSGVLKDSLNFKNGEFFGLQFHYDSIGRLYKRETARGGKFPVMVEMLQVKP